MKLLDVAEGLEWSVHIDEDCWEFEKFSPAGEDFGFEIPINGKTTPEDLVREVRLYADGFDTEEHVKMWLGAKENGVSGVPDLKTLVQDADDIVEMLNELADAMEVEAEKVKLSPSQQKRVDEVDGAMYRFLLTMLEKTPEELPFDVNLVETAVATLTEFLYPLGFDIHLPCIIQDGDRFYVSDGDYHDHEEDS